MEPYLTKLFRYANAQAQQFGSDKLQIANAQSQAIGTFTQRHAQLV